jgi:hypothetical protein
MLVVSIVKPPELRRCLWRELDTILNESGFTRVSYGRTGEYRRAVTGGSQQITFPTYSRWGRLEVYCPHVALHLDAVEEFVVRFEVPGPVPQKPRDIEMRSTLGLRLVKWSLIGLIERTWIISDESKAPKIARQLAPWVISKGTSFWEQFSDDRKLLRILSGDGKEFRRYGLDRVRAQRAVALTFLLDGKEAASNVAEAKLSVLRGDHHAEFKDWMHRALA